MKMSATSYFVKMAKLSAVTLSPKYASIAIPQVDKSGNKLNTPMENHRGVFISVTLAPTKRQPIR